MHGLRENVLKKRSRRRSGLLAHWAGALGLTLAAGFCAMPCVAEDRVDLSALDKDLADFRARLSRVHSAVDAAPYDPEAQVDRLEFEADAILEYVSNEVVFQPYEGTLRGVAGTLRAGAGNSLDQSILLASMLKSAGYDARVARGTLNDDEVLRLLRQTAAATPSRNLDYLQPSLDSAFPELAKARAAIDLKSTKASADTKNHSRALIEVLQTAGINLAPHDVTPRWLPVLREYFWVQHREGPSDAWQDSHPAFGASPAPPGVTAKGYFADSVPAKYHHTFTLRAWIESYQAGKVTQQALMSPWTVPVANHAGQTIRYRNAPSGLVPSTAGDLGKAIADTRYFMPMLNGDRAPGAQAFDLRGRVIDPFALGSPAAALFQTLGDKLASAAEEVQDDDDGQPVLALHSLWLEFTHTAPSGMARTQRRYLVAPRQDYSGDQQALAWPLITDHVYLLSSGGQPLDLLAERYLHTAMENMDWLRVMVHKMFQPDADQPMPAELPAEFPPLAQHWLMDHNPGSQPDVIAYRAEPGVIGLRRGYRDADTAFVAVDVVWNAVAHVQTDTTGLKHLPRAAIVRGAWDTALESVPARIRKLDPKSVASTVRVMDLAAAQRVPMKVLMPHDDNDLSGLGLDDAAQFFLQRDLEAGYAIVIPARLPADAAQAAWWRVHPETGETLGMTGDGYGQEMAEYLLDMAMTYQSLVDAVGALEECKTQPTMDTKLCCLVEANLNNVAGLGFGGIVGATTGTAGAAVFDIANRASGNSLMPSADAGCDQLPATAW